MGLIKKSIFVGFVFTLPLALYHQALAQKSTATMERAWFEAAESGDIEKMRELHKAGVDVETKDIFGNRATHLATMHRKIENLIILITELNANTRARNKFRKTIRSIAEARGHSEILDFLNSQSKPQRSPFRIFKCWS